MRSIRLAKVAAWGVGLALLMGAAVGCAGAKVYAPRLPVGARAQVEQYHSLPNGKAIVVAVEPGGRYACGVESGQYASDVAVAAAYERCVEACGRKGVRATPYLYAVNEVVVFERMVRAAAASADAREAQRQEFHKMRSGWFE